LCSTQQRNDTMLNIIERSESYNPYPLGYRHSPPFEKAVGALESFRPDEYGFNPVIGSILSVLQYCSVDFSINKNPPEYWAPQDWVWVIEPTLSKIAHTAMNAVLYYGCLFHALEQASLISPGRPEREYAKVVSVLLSEKITFAFKEMTHA